MSPLFEISRVLLRSRSRRPLDRKRESQRDVTDCGASHSRLRCCRASGSLYHRPPNGSATEIRSTSRRWNDWQPHNLG